MYLSIVEVTDDKKLARYQPCKTEAEALAHTEKYGGFVVKDIGGNQDFWIVDKDKKTITQDTATENSVIATRNIMAKITRLESTVTPRRIREMTTADGAKWVDDVEKLIAIERAKL